LTSIIGEEKQLLQSVKSIDDLLAVKHNFTTITNLKLENEALAVNFIASNFAYICSVLSIELNQAQRLDLLDEVGQVGWMTMADFKLFLDQMKRHKFFHRDYQELMAEFWKYCDDRLNRAAEIERGKFDSTDSYQRVAESKHIKDLAVFKIKHSLNQPNI
jgi:hypothetical protein